MEKKTVRNGNKACLGGMKNEGNWKLLSERDFANYCCNKTFIHNLMSSNGINISCLFE